MVTITRMGEPIAIATEMLMYQRVASRSVRKVLHMHDAGQA